MRDWLTNVGPERVRRTDAGRTTGPAAARLEVFARALHQRLVRAVKPLRESDAAGRHVEEVDRRSLCVRRADLDREAEIVWVAHEEERREAVKKIAETRQRDLDPLPRPSGDDALGQRAPERCRLQLLLGKMDPAPADVLVRVHRELLVDRGERAHEDLTVREIEAARRLMPVELVDDADANGELRLRVVVDLDLAHVGLRVVPVQPFDLELLRLVEIDRL